MIWRSQIYNLFREKLKFRGFTKAFRNFAKYVIAFIFAKFKYPFILQTQNLNILFYLNINKFKYPFILQTSFYSANMCTSIVLSHLWLTTVFMINPFRSWGEGGLVLVRLKHSSVVALMNQMSKNWKKQLKECLQPWVKVDQAGRPLPPKSL